MPLLYRWWLSFPNRWQYLVDEMLYRVYVVAWEWAEEEAKYKALSHRASLVASSSRNPDYGTGTSPAAAARQPDPQRRNEIRIVEYLDLY